MTDELFIDVFAPQDVQNIILTKLCKYAHIDKGTWIIQGDQHLEHQTTL